MLETNKQIRMDNTYGQSRRSMSYYKPQQVYHRRGPLKEEHSQQTIVPFYFHRADSSHPTSHQRKSLKHHFPPYPEHKEKLHNPPRYPRNQPSSDRPSRQFGAISQPSDFLSQFRLPANCKKQSETTSTMNRSVGLGQKRRGNQVVYERDNFDRKYRVYGQNNVSYGSTTTLRKGNACEECCSCLVATCCCCCGGAMLYGAT